MVWIHWWWDRDQPPTCSQKEVADVQRTADSPRQRHRQGSPHWQRVGSWCRCYQRDQLSWEEDRNIPGRSPSWNQEACVWQLTNPAWGSYFSCLTYLKYIYSKGYPHDECHKHGNTFPVWCKSWVKTEKKINEIYVENRLTTCMDSELWNFSNI